MGKNNGNPDLGAKKEKILIWKAKTSAAKHFTTPVERQLSDDFYENPQYVCI